jgi:hypothetical protein
MPQIHFNGKTYNDIAEMPAMERQAYEQLMSIFKDEDQDGTPDILQGDVVGNIIRVVRKSGGTGEGVEALERMSPEMRARISKGVAKLHELGFLSQIPNASEMDLESFGNREQASPLRTMPTWEDAEIRPSKPIIPSPSAIQEDKGNFRWLVTILVFLGLVICGIGVAVFFFLEQGL